MKSKETSIGLALKAAVQTLSKKKQVELITQHVYTKFEVFAKCKPLVAGIDKDLVEALPQYDTKLVIRMIGNHCRRPRYIKALAHGGKRYDLNNRAKGIVTEAEQEIAKEYLNKQQQQREKNTLSSTSE